MKKSIGDNIFPKGVSFENGLQLLKRAGYDGVELWLGEREWFQIGSTDSQMREMRQKIEDAGLRVSNISNSLDWKENVSARDASKREAAFRHIQRQIEAAQIFNTDAILIVAGLVTSDAPYNEVYKRTLDSLKKLAPDAAAAKVKIGVENCCSEQKFLLSPREFNAFLSDVDSPWVGIHLDVGNIHDTGFAEQWIEILGPKITRVHLKDVHTHRGRCGNQSVYTNIFLGDNNWRAIRDAFTKVGYDGWLIAEMEAKYTYAPDQQIYDTAAAMNRVISGNL
ncbi:MAG: sugar phosphate isomerase/epimerase [Acidobacteriaceae bacterium]|nr:sugar phosphate isomerase/epimerase [Acidobacteriaceae bacterium]MBV9502061.1 sugar phosphate isomerase/epimerase [Acidobacteriaceae bacterium]